MADGSAVPSNIVYRNGLYDQARIPQSVPDRCYICGEPVTGSRFPGGRLCTEHAFAAYTLKLQRDREPPPPPAPRASIVYYLLFGDRIKIGYTTNLAARLANIPHDQVLATEPGGREVETARHRQFAAYKAKGEWFHHNPELALHIAELQDRAQQ